MLLQFLLVYLFLLSVQPPLTRFRNSLFFFSEDHLAVTRRPMHGLDWTMSSAIPVPHLGGFVFTWMCSVTRESASKLLSSVLLSAHLSMCSINSKHSFWATDPVSSPTVWPVQTYCFKLHHFNDGMRHIASVKGHPSDTRCSNTQTLMTWAVSHECF